MIQKVLIIDDSMLARMAVRKCLSDIAGLTFQEASDGQQGVLKFSEFFPDLTFCDLTMPNMSGFEAVNEMLKIAPAATVIVLTADAQKITIEKVMASGAFMVINKPPKKDEILAAFSKAQERANA